MNDLLQFIKALFYLEFGSLKYDCAIKTSEIFSFRPLMNRSVTTELCFLLLIISAIISLKTINTLSFFPRFHSLIFLQTSFISSEYSIKVLGSLR